MDVRRDMNRNACLIPAKKKDGRWPKISEYQERQQRALSPLFFFLARWISLNSAMGRNSGSVWATRMLHEMQMQGWRARGLSERDCDTTCQQRSEATHVPCLFSLVSSTRCSVDGSMKTLCLQERGHVFPAFAARRPGIDR